MPEPKSKKTIRKTRKKKTDNESADSQNPEQQPVQEEAKSPATSKKPKKQAKQSPDDQAGPSSDDQAKQPSDKPVWDVSQLDTDSIDTDEVDVSSNIVEIPKVRHVRVQHAKNKTKPAGNAPKGQKKGHPKKTSKKPPKTRQPNGEPIGTEQMAIPNELGILALRNVVVFPGTVIPLAVGRPRSRRLLAALASGELTPAPEPLPQDTDEAGESIAPAVGDNIIGVLTQKDPATDNPGFDDLYTMGTIVTVLKTLKLPDGQNSLVVHGLVRFRVVEWISAEPFLKARIEVIATQAEPSKNLLALVANVRHSAERMVELAPNIPDEVSTVLSNIEDAGALADFLAANINIAIEPKQALLESTDIMERLKKLSVALAGQLELLELSAKIHQQVSQSIDKTQREYFLQEQLKAIQSELGQTDQKSTEIQELKDRIIEAEMPEKVQAEAERELNRLTKIPMMSPEFGVVRSYIEWLCELPWSKSTTDKLNLNAAKRILNADHYDLVKVKKRILEFLAVRKLNPKGRSPILCLAGPPGVGKTSLGKSIARSMDREFVRISLGGIRDEADIRGHRRTYIGALPGRIIQELRKCGSNNPVFMLDELDKVGQDFRGDPASALLEVLDPEQNNSFTDHYIDQPFDLSQVIFIGTANYMGPVPPALRDRMEVLDLPGYTTDEKLAIAKRFLVPRQLKENGLTERTLKIKQDALLTLIESYTREAGVRELERKIAAVCRAIAAEIAANKRKSATVSPNQVSKLLGPIAYEPELALRTGTPGVATGLAYTPVGGEILFVESTVTPGTGQLILTGQLGDVMKESAQTALSVLKSLSMAKGSRRLKLPAALLKLLADAATFDHRDIHVHVPAGAIPKDGPSAGSAIFISIASLLADMPVRADIAMTGEITLTGLVLPIGGVKEKVLAAKRAGIKTVILPDRNRKDLTDLPKKALTGLKFQFVRRVEQVLKIALNYD